MGLEQSKPPAFFATSTKKPVFIPDVLVGGYGVGIGFNTYGKTFLFVGKLEGSEQQVLAVSDWSKPAADKAESKFVTNMKKLGIHLTDKQLVDDKFVHTTYHPSLYAISDLTQILSILKLIEAAQIQKKSLSDLQSVTEAALKKLTL